MNAWQRLAARVWDNLPGGVPAQNTVWEVAPPLARYLERLANRRDAERRAARWTEDQL
jgi:hypothetical protein